MSKAFRKHLVSHLKKQSKAALEAQLLLLYDRIPQAEDFFRLQLGKATDDIFKKYCHQIQDALYPDGSFEGGMDIDKVDHIIFTLDKLTSDIHLQVKIRIYAIQEATQLAHTYGGDYGEDFYIYFEELYEAVLIKLEQFELSDSYRHEMLQTAQRAYEGYGHYDVLMEHYNKYYGQNT